MNNLRQIESDLTNAVDSTVKSSDNGSPWKVFAMEMFGSTLECDFNASGGAGMGDLENPVSKQRF